MLTMERPPPNQGDVAWLKVSEVAKRLRISEMTVKRWLTSGRLKGVRLGGRKLGWRISVAEFQRFVDAGGAREEE